MSEALEQRVVLLERAWPELARALLANCDALAALQRGDRSASRLALTEAQQALERVLARKGRGT